MSEAFYAVNSLSLFFFWVVIYFANSREERSK